eukprot:symbB.v1.2.007502.t1/scaffold444.1/size204903/2
MWGTRSDGTGPYSALKSQSLISIHEDDSMGVMWSATDETAARDERKLALAWLLQSPDTEVSKVLGILAERKAWLLTQALEDVAKKGASPRPGSAREPTPRTRQYSERSLRMAPASSARPDKLSPSDGALGPVVTGTVSRNSRNQTWESCTVQFSSAVYFVGEESEEVVLDVIRVGPTERRCEVEIRTHSGSAKAGQEFKATERILSFEPDEVLKSIHVELFDNTRWDTHMEFSAKLSNPMGAVLGEYLSEAHVRIIDDDLFPSNRFKDEIENNDFEGVSSELLTDYIHRNLSDPLIRIGTIKMILAGVFDSLFMMSKLLVHLYILQFVVHVDFPVGELIIVQDRLGSLYLSMAVLLVLFGVQHWLHYIAPTWRVGGLSRRVLQHGVLSAFLVYNEESRTHVDNGKIVMAMVYDVPNLVTNGYMNVVNMINAAGKLLIILAFQIFVPPLMGKRPTLLGLAPALLIPFLTSIFLRFRSESQTKSLRETENKESDLISFVTESVRTFRLISDFGKSSLELEKFLGKIGAYNSSVVASLQMGGNNAKFVEWLTMLSISLYTIWGGMQVIEGDLDLPLYVTNIGVFNAAGAAATDFCHVLLQMQKVTPSLERLVRYINLPTDLPKRMDLECHRRVATSRLAGESHKELGPGFVLDELPIIISELEFSYPGALPRSFGGRMEMPQGQVLAIAGKCGQGKSTLIRILAGRNLPRLRSEESLFFIPSHIKVLYVPHTPLFIHGTLYENLTYGVAGKGRDDNMDRVLNICERLLLPPVVLNEIASRETLERDWSSKLSSTQCQALLLARAFITNPELLCLEKPTEQFPKDQAENICMLIREHVNGRGLEVEDSKMLLRRPRTCIFSTIRLNCIQTADKAYIVNRDVGVRVMAGSDVTESMLSVRE